MSRPPAPLSLLAFLLPSLLFAAAVCSANASEIRGASAATVGAREARDPVINVLDYGAFNDYKSHVLSSLFGSLAAARTVYPAAKSLTDEADVAAIQAALDATDATWGGAVFLPKGGYALNAGVHLRHPHIHLYGAGQTETQLITNSTSFNVIQLDQSYLQLSDFWINQYGAAGDTPVWAIHDESTGAYDLDVSRIEISGGHSGIYSKGGRTLFFRCKITQIAAGRGVGMQFDGNSEIHDIISPYMENGGRGNAAAGIFISSGADYTISGAQLQKMGSPLIVRPAAGDGVASIKVAHSYFDTSSGPGLLFDGRAATIVNVTLDSPWSSANAVGLQILGNVNGLSLSNVELLGNSGAGIDAGAATNVDGLTVDGGKISGNGGAGITIGPGLSRFAITGTLIGPSGQYGANGRGLVIAKGADYFSVVGNDIFGNTGAQFSDESAGTHQVVSANQAGEAVGPGAFLGPTGQTNSAAGAQSGVLAGYGNQANVLGAAAWGNANRANGAWSTAHGQEVDNRNRLGVDCYGSNWFGAGTQGSAQTCTSVLNNSSDSARAARLTSDGTGSAVGTGSAQNCVNLPLKGAYLLGIDVVAFDTVSAAAIAWNHWTGLMSRGETPASTTVWMDPLPAPLGQATVVPSLAAAADKINGCLDLTVTPPAGNTHSWHFVARVQTVEVQ